MVGIVDGGPMPPAVLVLGAGGGFGRGVVEAAVEAGRPVVAVAAGEAALWTLRARHPQADLTALAAPLRSDGDAARLASRLRALRRPLDGAIAAIAGEHACGRLLDRPADLLRRALDEDLLPHLSAARQLFPLLSRSAGDSVGYVLLGGPGGGYPWAGYGHRSIAAAALRMLARVLHEEARREGVRVQLLSVEAPVRGGEDDPHACAGWPRAAAIGRRALALLERHPGAVPAVVEYPDAWLLDAGEAEVASSRPAASTARVTDAAIQPSSLLPARDLRAARRLLDALSPPPHPGPRHDEHS